LLLKSRLLIADDFFAQDVPTDITPVDINVVNPWGSEHPPGMPTQEKDVSPVKEASAWAAFNEAPTASESSWDAFKDCEMKSEKHSEDEQHLDAFKQKDDAGETIPNETPPAVLEAAT